MHDFNWFYLVGFCICFICVLAVFAFFGCMFLVYLQAEIPREARAESVQGLFWLPIEEEPAKEEIFERFEADASLGG